MSDPVKIKNAAADAVVRGGASGFLRGLSAQEFKALGSDHIAYMKPVIVENRRAFAIFAADGSLLSVEDAPDAAIFAARSSGFAPVMLQ